MEFTAELKEVLRNQPVQWDTNTLDSDWIYFIIDTPLRNVDEFEFSNLVIRQREGSWKGNQVFSCEQLLFKGEVVAEKFAYGDWDDTFDEEMDWVVESKQEEIMDTLYHAYKKVKFPNKQR